MTQSSMERAKGIHTRVKVGVITMTTVNKHITVMEAPCRLTAKAAGRKKSKLDARVAAVCIESSMMKTKNKKREKENS